MAAEGLRRAKRSGGAPIEARRGWRGGFRRDMEGDRMGAEGPGVAGDGPGGARRV